MLALSSPPNFSLSLSTVLSEHGEVIAPICAKVSVHVLRFCHFNPSLCFHFNPLMFYRACVICLFIYPIFSFSHAGLQVLGHYIRRQQDPETFIKEIKTIASDPEEKYFFNVTDEAALNDIVDALGDRIFTLEGL